MNDIANPPSTPVALAEVTKKNLGKVLDLTLAPGQENFVAPNAFSVAQAYFEKTARFHAIEAGGEFVGFVQYIDPSLSDLEPSEKEMTAKEREEMYLWRYMIDARFQKCGYGRKALDLLCDHARTRPGIKRIRASFVDAPGGPEDFYMKYGFKKTGNFPHDEVEILFDL